MKTTLPAVPDDKGTTEPESTDSPFPPKPSDPSEAEFKDVQGYWKRATLVTYVERVRDAETLQAGSIVRTFEVAGLGKTILQGHRPTTIPNPYAWIEQSNVLANQMQRVARPQLKLILTVSYFFNNLHSR